VNESQVFTNALKFATPAERAAYLDEVCAGNAELRAGVEALLHAHADDPGFLEQPAGSLWGTVDGPAAPALEERLAEAGIAEQPGMVLGGRYKLLQLIGEGGMGAVWLAEQMQPVQRKVALKIIKAGMDSRQVLARFDAERQALALMDHPNIAKVLDGGVVGQPFQADAPTKSQAGEPDLQTGRPFFVMELVKGLPIAKYCDELRLTPRERLELFLPVCQAIQHAHQKGIIHRDIKPSNVLVAPYDGKPVVKVIDFGVAKATGQPLTEKTLFTEFGAVIGTLEYMSPEQAELNNQDIDTRSDIYALGVLLYELLTGTTPLDRARLKNTPFTEMLRKIREEEPPRPSTRLSEAKETLPAISARRQMEPAKLTRLVRGELDWIAMKALEKDRNRRYESANALAADLQRYLADEPVQACPPSAGYRLRKFARRNRGRLVAGAVLGLALLVGASGIGWTALERAVRRGKAANEQELAMDRVEQFLKDRKWPDALAAFQRAELLAREAGPDPARNARLAALKQRLDDESGDQDFIARFEDIRLQMQSQLDPVKGGFILGAALPEIREALRQYGIAVGDMAPARVGAIIQGRPEVARRNLVAALDECLALAPQKDVPTRKWLLAALEAADRDDWRGRARKARMDADWKALAALAREADVRAQPPSFLVLVARDLREQMRTVGLELLRRAQSAYPADLWSNHWLAFELRKAGQPAEAIRYYTAALALRPENAGIYLNLGTTLREAGELDAAITAYRRCLALAPRYAMAHFGLANVLRDKGQLDESIAECREAIRLKPDYVEAHHNLGATLSLMGRLDEAITELCEAIRIKKDLPEAHYELGRALKRKGRLDEAIAEYREAIRLEKDFAEAHLNLGVALYRKGRLDEAIAEYREAIRLKKDYALAHNNLGNALYDKRQLDEAIAEYRQAIRIKMDYAEGHLNLGVALHRKDRLDEATAEYREAIRLDKDYALAHFNLGNALRDKGQLDEAIAEYREAIRIKNDYGEAHSNLGIVLARKRRLDAAIAEFREAIRLKKDYAQAHNRLGKALFDKGQLDAAIAEYREAIRINKDFANAHLNLGAAFMRKGRLDEAAAEFRQVVRLEPGNAEAIACLGDAHFSKGELEPAIAAYRKAIGIKKDYAQAHCQLGLALRQQGNFREALEQLRRGHVIGSRDRRWRYSSAQWVRECERLVELDGQLPGFLAGIATPPGPAERIELARLCSLKRLHRAAAHFYEEAFALRPRLADALDGGHRYKAACAAALAGCGQGKDADKLEDKERARLRRQALDWLRADLEAWGRLLDKKPPGAVSPASIATVFQRWLTTHEFAGLRGPEARARLSEAERQAWEHLWSDVAGMLARAQGKKPAKKPDAQ
jgi:tetratricopeptide (TPR) repeat protein